MARISVNVPERDSLSNGLRTPCFLHADDIHLTVVGDGQYLVDTLMDRVSLCEGKSTIAKGDRSVLTCS